MFDHEVGYPTAVAGYDEGVAAAIRWSVETVGEDPQVLCAAVTDPTAIPDRTVRATGRRDGRIAEHLVHTLPEPERSDRQSR
ncbi:hypothetical protein [Rhodococcus rhodochrous]|uniref:hypothetical protein n=1 Tax=Rhodococcus rhodochrous TaxID=1829 RepID=UPI00188BE2CF|nr:hypothetical protein [Rhodococcus rhodochrous]MBF4479544.1 hypothetical protein [Rhodococcus rhodochrous]